MRKLGLIVLVAAALVVAGACSNANGLTGRTWQLTSITETNPPFQGVVPLAEQTSYTVDFKPGGTLSAKADCNQVSGAYVPTSAGGLTITIGPTTLVACQPGSMSQQFVQGLSQAASYVIANDLLTITLTGGGSLVFS